MGLWGSKNSIAADNRGQQRKACTWKELMYILRTHPMTVIIPFLVFAVGVVVGVFVIRATEHARQQTSRTSAQNVAIQAAQSTELQLVSLIQPVLSMRVFVRQGLSNYSAIHQLFPALAADLLQSTQGESLLDLGQQLQLAPQAIISDIYPYNDETKSGIGLDLLGIERRRNGTLETMRHGNVTVTVLRFEEGPLAFLTATAVYVRVPRNHSFEQPGPQSPYCRDLCYTNTTGSKFWGFVYGAFYMDALLLDPNGPIQKLVTQGYRYQLVQLGGGALDPTPGYGSSTLLSRSEKSVQRGETVTINLQGGFKGFQAWELSVSPEDGWESSVAQAMYAVVVIVSAIVAALLCALLISRVQNRALLFALVPEHVVNTLKSRHQYYSGTAVDVLATSTPAEVMLDLLSRCLEGELPQVATVVQLRAALLSLQDLYRPANMSQALDALNLDADVTDALMRELQGIRENRKAADEGEEEEEEDTQGGDGLSSLMSASDDLSIQEVLVQLVTCQTPKKGALKAVGGTPIHSNNSSFLIETVTSEGRARDSSALRQLRSKSLVVEDNKLNNMAGPISLGEPVWSELHMLLEAGWSSWTWDAFALDDLTQGHPLSTLAFFLIHKGGLIQQLGLPQTKLARFLHALEAGYINNSYHNRTHAADVLQTMHVIITKGGMVPGYADPIRHLACLLAAAAHDVDHAGLTNDFLITTEAPLAIRYSDRSPMENHHLATMFTLLKHPDNDFTRGLPKESRDILRKVIIELVLGTDMKQHMTITAQFKSVHHQAQKSERMSVVNDVSPVMVVGHEASAERTPVDEAEQMLSLQMALKVADLGSLAESHEVNVRWVDVLEEEFFQQGDQERQLGLPISPLFDRNKPGAAKCQVGFFSFVGLPLFNSFVQVFPDAQPFLDAAEDNFRHWKSVSAPPARTSDQSEQLSRISQASRARNSPGSAAAVLPLRSSVERKNPT